MRSDPRAAAAAMGWLGTPYVTGQAVRGRGCDCVGLVRGVWSELTGRPLPEVPGWRRDWADARGRPLLSAARAHLVEADPGEAGPGSAVILRLAGREVHTGILGPPDAEGNPTLIHAVEGVGVARVPLGHFRPAIVFAGAFPVS